MNGGAGAEISLLDPYDCGDTVKQIFQKLLFDNEMSKKAKNGGKSPVEVLLWSVPAVCA